MKLYDIMKEDQSSIKAQMHNALDRYFPEFLSVFKDWTGKAALHLLDKGYLPEDIVQASEEELLLEVKQTARRAVGRSEERRVGKEGRGRWARGPARERPKKG